MIPISSGRWEVDIVFMFKSRLHRSKISTLNDNQKAFSKQRYKTRKLVFYVQSWVGKKFPWKQSGFSLVIPMTIRLNSVYTY